MSVGVLRSSTMPKATARVLAEGRVTIPATVREALGIEHGDYVEVDVEPLDPGAAP